MRWDASRLGRAAKWPVSTRVRVAALSIITTAVVTGGIAAASVPGPDGTIHSCYTNKGVIRIIDSSKSCPAGTHPLNWNQQGSPGLKGDTGAPGDSTVAGLTVTVTGNVFGSVNSPGAIDCDTGPGGPDCTEVYPIGTVVTLTPDLSQGDLSWGGDCSGSNTPCTLTMDGTKSVTASFAGASPPPPSGGPLAATEMMTNPVSGEGQWIELTNWGSDDLDAGGTEITTNEATCIVPDGVTVPADGLVVIGQPGFTYPFAVAGRCDFALPTLPTGTDVLHVFGPTGSIFALTLSDLATPAEGHPVGLDGAIGSIHDTVHFLEAQVAQAWCPVSDDGTPGAINTNTC